MFTFQYYENKVWNKAKIHVADCSFCNHGEGIHPGSSTENGHWSEPFSSIDEACESARRTGRKVSLCKRCMTMDLSRVA